MVIRHGINKKNGKIKEDCRIGDRGYQQEAD
jgi:hypothetical protein